jgi:hypothetical protein
MSTVIIDPDAFYPFRSLVRGPLPSLDELEAIEEFVRAVVLHDEMVMESEPFAFDEQEHEWTNEEIEAGGRNVIVAIGPVVDEYRVFTDRRGPRQVLDIELAPGLLNIAARFSNAGPGNVYFEAHTDFLKRLVQVLEAGGSVACKGQLATEAIELATHFPAQFFEHLDADWQAFGERANLGQLGVFVPPILAIILTRSASREAIPIVLHDLRDEWTTARQRIWELVAQLKTARTIAEVSEIERELRVASEKASPFRDSSSSPFRVFWELLAAWVGGAALTGMAGGNVNVGAAGQVIAQAVRILQGQADSVQALFGRGAFDLARRVRRETARAEMQSLRNILSQSEREALGL